MFKENRLHGMLEASDYEAIDSLSLFLGALANNLCDLLVNTEMKKGLTEYADMMNFSYKRQMHFGWTGESIQHLESCIFPSKQIRE